MGHYLSTALYSTQECYESVSEPTVRTEEDVSRRLKEVEPRAWSMSKTEGYFERNKISIDTMPGMGVSADDSLLPSRKIVVLTHETTKSV